MARSSPASATSRLRTTAGHATGTSPHATRSDRPTARDPAAPLPPLRGGGREAERHMRRRPGRLDMEVALPRARLLPEASGVHDTAHPSLPCPRLRLLVRLRAGR